MQSSGVYVSHWSIATFNGQIFPHVYIATQYVSSLIGGTDTGAIFKSCINTKWEELIITDSRCSVSWQRGWRHFASVIDCGENDLDNLQVSLYNNFKSILIVKINIS